MWFSIFGLEQYKNVYLRDFPVLSLLEITVEDGEFETLARRNRPLRGLAQALLRVRPGPVVPGSFWFWSVLR